ncbi:hypothetical protein BGZ95_007268 [Linnemannia exigua]|uniref:Uncharacterized protein n=1 Tax=Linnemannia exigua TaxID=604196 RepID=A0AAD4D0L2_9FUNG|nr:hypothetical protein BGZ95_007268 [Linnemannia exigua]
MSAQIDLIIEQMEILMEEYPLKINFTNTTTGDPNETPGDYNYTPGGNITLLAYPPFIKTLDQIKVDMLDDAERPDKLNLQAGTVRRTIIGAGRVMVAIKPLFLKKNVNASLPMIQDMRDLLPLIDSVIECSGGNQSDCSGITQLWRDFNDAAVERINEIAETSPHNATLKDLTQQLQNVTNIIEEVFKSRNDSTLPEAGKLLSSIIGIMSGDASIYMDASNGVNLYFEAAKEALKCEGYNITVFADKCLAYGDRTRGLISMVITWLKRTVGAIPIIGPLIINPLLSAIDDILLSAQEGFGTALGKIFGIIMGIIKIFGLLPNTEDEESDPATAAILEFMGISDIAGDCGGKKARCVGLIEIARILLQAAVSIVDGIPLIGWIIAKPLGVLVDLVAKVLEYTASGLITAAMFAINAAAAVINTITLGATTNILGTLTSGLEEIARCWATSEDEDDVDTPPTQSLLSHSKTLTFF